MLTILITPPITTAGQFTYLGLHLLHTLGMKPILTLPTPATKRIREELDVTYIGNLGLYLVHL